MNFIYYCCFSFRWLRPPKRYFLWRPWLSQWVPELLLHWWWASSLDIVAAVVAIRTITHWWVLAFILGCNAFGNEPIWSPDSRSPNSCPPGQTILIKLIPLDKWSPSNSIPLDKWSPNIWSPWTNGPQPIWSPYFWIPTVCPSGQKECSRDYLSRGTKLVGDHLSRVTKFFGTICPWGLNWLGTVCPKGSINWGPIVWDQMSGDHMCLGPNVSQPILFANYGILLAKLFLPTVRNNCSSNGEKLMKFEAEGQEFSKSLRSLCLNSERSEQFLVTECFFNLFLEVFSHRINRNNYNSKIHEMCLRNIWMFPNKLTVCTVFP